MIKIKNQSIEKLVSEGKISYLPIEESEIISMNSRKKERDYYKKETTHNYLIQKYKKPFIITGN